MANRKQKQPKKGEKKDEARFMTSLRNELEQEMFKQQLPLGSTIREESQKKVLGSFLWTGIEGLDKLLINGVPKGSRILLAGGAGSGKTIAAMQMLYHHAANGKKCVFLSFEESEDQIRGYMKSFGWDPEKLEKKGNLIIKRFSTLELNRRIDALLMKAKGELLIDVDPILLPKNIKPDMMVIDSLTAIDAMLGNKDNAHLLYVEQLFRFFERINATVFLISETEQIPKMYSRDGVNESLADGIFVFYNVSRGNVRENAIEILKLRGVKHQKRIVAMQITDNGIKVYPEQEIFGDLSRVS